MPDSKNPDSNDSKSRRNRFRRTRLYLGIIAYFGIVFAAMVLIAPDRMGAGLRPFLTMPLFTILIFEAIFGVGDITDRGPPTWSRSRSRIRGYLRLFLPILAFFFILGAWKDYLWIILLSQAVALLFYCELLPFAVDKVMQMEKSPNFLISKVGPF